MNKSLTKTELEIMQYIWSKDSEVTAADIREHFSNKHWSKQSVTIFLKKLVNAHFLNIRKESKTKYYYSASITEQEYSILPAKNVLKNVFKNSFVGFCCALVPQDTNDNDIRLLEELLAELKKELPQNDETTK